MGIAEIEPTDIYKSREISEKFAIAVRQLTKHHHFFMSEVTEPVDPKTKEKHQYPRLKR